MRFSNIALSSVAALATLASAVGNAIVVNKCPSTLYVWSVGASISPATALSTGDNFTEQFYRDPVSGGIAIKIAKSANGIFDGSPQTDFAFNLINSAIWYDLNDVFGDPFSGSSVNLAPSDNACASIVWSNGIPPAGSQVKVCESNTNLTLTLC